VRFPWGEVLVGPRAPDQTAPASYDWRGTRYEWHPAVHPRLTAALDVERLDTPRPDRLVPKGWDMVRFLAAWTRAEAMCKLLDVPIALWLRANLLETVETGAWIRGEGLWNRRCWTNTRLCRSKAVVCTFGIANLKTTNSALYHPVHGHEATEDLFENKLDWRA